MLIYPEMNPVLLHIAGPISIRWYGVLYLISFAVGWLLLRYRAAKRSLPWTADQIADLVFYVALGVVVGGRTGYMLIYALPEIIHAPLSLFKVWEGGMSFHGGFLGVLLAVAWWSRQQKIPYFQLMDFIAPVVPLGLAAGRLGNFINGELYGRITQMPWGMIYPDGGFLPRHPVELYEFALEGIMLFCMLWFFSRKQRPRMQVSGLFLIGYGLARCFCELFRQPDPQFGFIAFGWLTMGQLLSFPMILLGIVLLWCSLHRAPVPGRKCR